MTGSRFACALAATLCLGAFGVAEEPAKGPAREVVLAVFDFTSPKGQAKVGRQVALQFTNKLKRTGKFIVTDAHDLNIIVRAKKVDLYKLPVQKAVDFIRGEVGADIAIFGEAARRGEAMDLRFRVVELKPQSYQLLADVDRTLPHFRDTTEFIQVTVWALAGMDTPKERVVSKVTSGNLLKNGDFEKVDEKGIPVGWEYVDNLCSKVIDAGGKHGKVLLIDTDVPLSQWTEWRARLKDGANPKNAPRKRPTVPPKYNTVAATKGMAVYGPLIKVKPGQAYRIEFDARGKWAEPWFFPKMFVRGYKFREGQYREIWRMYKAQRFKTAGREWEHFSRTFHPDEGCEFMRVIVYAYWPPYDKYMYDNISIVEVSEKWVEGQWEKAPLKKRR